MRRTSVLADLDDPVLRGTSTSDPSSAHDDSDLLASKDDPTLIAAIIIGGVTVLDTVLAVPVDEHPADKPAQEAASVSDVIVCIVPAKGEEMAGEEDELAGRSRGGEGRVGEELGRQSEEGQLGRGGLRAMREKRQHQEGGRAGVGES